MAAENDLRALRNAVRLVRQVRDHLCVEWRECSGCGAKKFEDWNQATADQALGGAETRIRRAIGMLTNGGGANGAQGGRDDEDEPTASGAFHSPF